MNRCRADPPAESVSSITRDKYVASLREPSVGPAAVPGAVWFLREPPPQLSKS